MEGIKAGDVVQTIGGTEIQIYYIDNEDDCIYGIDDDNFTYKWRLNGKLVLDDDMTGTTNIPSCEFDSISDAYDLDIETEDGFDNMSGYGLDTKNKCNTSLTRTLDIIHIPTIT